jgi:hypothetical protein
MPVPARDPDVSAKPAERPPAPPARALPGARARNGGPSPARALTVQRSAGNRAAGRILARWVKHPDPKQKGVVVPDSTAEEFTRFNPPKNE